LKRVIRHRQATQIGDILAQGELAVDLLARLRSSPGIELIHQHLVLAKPSASLGCHQLAKLPFEAAA
jgi:hypothetical protein